MPLTCQLSKFASRPFRALPALVPCALSAFGTACMCMLGKWKMHAFTHGTDNNSTQLNSVRAGRAVPAATCRFRHAVTWHVLQVMRSRATAHVACTSCGIEGEDCLQRLRVRDGCTHGSAGGEEAHTRGATGWRGGPTAPRCAEAAVLKQLDAPQERARRTRLATSGVKPCRSHAACSPSKRDDGITHSRSRPQGLIVRSAVTSDTPPGSAMSSCQRRDLDLQQP